jgi:hypothetical protein
VPLVGPTTRAAGTTRRLGSLVMGLALGAAAAAPAQQVRGRVVSAADSAPMPSALVALVAAGGARVAQTSSGQGGVFYLDAPAPGRYVVAVLRIGQRPWRSAAFDLGPGTVREVTLAVPADPIVLEPISVRARSTCRTSPREGSAVSALLGEADKALTVTRLAMEHRQVAYAVERYRRTLTPDGETVDSSATVDNDLSWPIRSAPPQDLAAHGFVRADAPDSARPLGGYTYFGPDPALLLSPWFLATHCFGVADGTGSDSGAVVVTFRPESGRRPDIEGRLVLDRISFELRRLEWSYVRLPWSVTPRGAGGEMNFTRSPEGVFIPWSWSLRAPVAEVDRRQQPVGVAGWREAGGRLLARR